MTSIDTLGSFLNQESKDAFDSLVAHIGTREEVTVFAGAGVSAGEGMPTWKELWDLFRKKASERQILRESEFIPEDAPRQLEELVEIIGDDDAIQIMRESFNLRISRIPETYTILESISTSLVTTNYDNFLESTAFGRDVNPEIEVYPSVLGRSRYIYLHGQAKSARSIENLVLTESSYIEAYNRWTHPLRSVMLVLMLDRLCIFVGFSMRDYDLDHALREVDQFRRRVFENHGRRGEEINRTPAWFVFLPEPTISAVAQQLSAHIDPSLLQDAKEEDKALSVRRQSESLRSRGIRPIWYRRDENRTHAQLLVLLRLLREARAATPTFKEDSMFLRYAEELEALGGVQRPSEEQRVRAADLIQLVPGAQSHFLQHVRGVEWYPFLKSEGLILAVPEPVEDASGKITIQQWDAARYVLLLVSEKPEYALDVLENVHSSNWHALAVLSQVLHELPPELARRIAAEKASQWLSTPYIRLTVVERNLRAVIKRLAAESDFDVALKVVSEVLWPVKDSRAYVTSRAAEDTADLLIEDIGEWPPSTWFDVANCFAVLLRELSSLEGEANHNSVFWTVARPIISDNPDRSIYRQFSDSLVDGLRDVLARLLEADQSQAESLLRNYLTGKDIILRRIAIFTIASAPEQFRNLDKIIFSEEVLFERSSIPEITLALESRFTFLKADLREKVLSVVVEGPSATQPELARERVDWFRWRLLTALPAELHSNGSRGVLDTLNEQFGVLQDATNNVRPVAAFVTAPFSLEDAKRILLEEGPEALLEVIRNPGTRFQVGWSNSSEAAWSYLGAIASDYPSDALRLAPFLAPTEFRHPEASWYPHAFMEAANNGVIFDWEPLIGLAERSLDDVAEASDADSSAWFGSLGRMLEAGLFSTNRIPQAYLDRVQSFFFELVERYCTELSVVVPGDDLRMRQLNTPAGIAADGLASMSGRYLDPTVARDEDWQSRVDRYIAWFEGAAKGDWGGQEGLYALGARLYSIGSLCDGWLDATVARVFALQATDRAPSAGVPFLVGYLSNPQLRNGVMESMRDWYHFAVTETISEVGYAALDSESQKQLGIHIVIGWLRGVSGFESEGLLGRMLEHASDELLAHIAWYIGKELRQVNGIRSEYSRQLQAKAQEYWRRRAIGGYWLRDEGELREHGEADNFTFWLKSLVATPDKIEAELVATIPAVAIGVSLENVTQYLLMHVEDSPDIVARIATAVVERWISTPELAWTQNSFQDLLEKLLPSHESLVRDMVASLLRVGRADLRNILA